MYAPSQQKGHQAYVNNSVNTQSQGNLIIMLYDGAIRFITIAESAIENNKLDAANTNIIKAQKIVTELNITLNMEVGPISYQLRQLYDYMYQQLIQANLKKDLQCLEEVKGMLIDLRNTWKKIL